MLNFSDEETYLRFCAFLNRAPRGGGRHSNEEIATRGVRAYEQALEQFDRLVQRLHLENEPEVKQAKAARLYFVLWRDKGGERGVERWCKRALRANVKPANSQRESREARQTRELAEMMRTPKLPT
jgi:hypothetical protein